MDLNLLLSILFLAFQQVLNNSLFVTKTEPFNLLTEVIHTFENAGIFYNSLF